VVMSEETKPTACVCLYTPSPLYSHQPLHYPPLHPPPPPPPPLVSFNSTLSLRLLLFCPSTRSTTTSHRRNVVRTTRGGMTSIYVRKTRGSPVRSSDNFRHVASDTQLSNADTCRFMAEDGVVDTGRSAERRIQTDRTAVQPGPRWSSSALLGHWPRMASSILEGQ